MARITYGIYLNGKDHCYVISNAETKYAEDIVDETFTNLPIKMTVEALSHSWEDTFDASDNPFNHPEIQENLEAVLRGELAHWRLTGVNVGEHGIYLVYYTTEPEVVLSSGEESRSGQVCVYGSYTLLFEVEHTDGSPAERYRITETEVPDIKHPNRMTKEVRVTEYVGKRKRRELVMRGDDHGHSQHINEQYCVVTEY